MVKEEVRRMYKISEVAKISKITIRTLHYYDEIGILSPSIDNKGYRVYSEEDLLRLQQILFFREMDFSLKEIKDIIDNPGFNREESLINHREILIKKKARLEKIIETINKSIKEEGTMSKEDMFNGFSMKEINEHKNKYAKEVKEKYRESNAYKESEIKTSKYTKEKWEEIMKEANSIYTELASYIGVDPGSEEVQYLIEKWRNHISENYYNCTVEIFKGLGEMYVSDSRFTENINKVKKGLSEFLSNGIKIYCERKETTN